MNIRIKVTHSLSSFFVDALTVILDVGNQTFNPFPPYQSVIFFAWPQG